ncbi:MAG: pilus assembly protein [Alphaproteobacteria bacterium]|nr:pilus assembly protein [Alphaproteobacteria bacterium]
MKAAPHHINPAQIKKCAAQFGKDRRGAFSVEFAIILPAFLMILFGVFEFGRLMWTRATIQYVCEEAGRWAMVNTTATSSAIQTQAQNIATGLGPAGDATYTVTLVVGPPQFADIQASYTFTFLIPFASFADTVLTGRSRVPLISD